MILPTNTFGTEGLSDETINIIVFFNQKLLQIIFIFISFLVAFNIDYASLRRFEADFFFREHHFAYVC